MAIRFTEEDVRPMGLVAAGVNGIKLKVGDAVVGAVVLNPKFEVFILASDGIAKRVKASQFPT
jgi:DNA gyrase subunit A